MTRWGVLLVAACLLGAAACDDDSPTSPSAQPLTFRATMSSANEVPPVSNAETGASGTATITLTPTRDASNAVTGGTVTMSFTVQGFPAGSNITAAHIHGPNAPAGTNAGVLINAGVTPIPMPVGSASFTSAAVSVTDAAIINGIMSSPGTFYFNVHTTLNPGGAVRGQLVAQ